MTPDPTAHPAATPRQPVREAVPAKTTPLNSRRFMKHLQTRDRPDLARRNALLAIGRGAAAGALGRGVGFAASRGAVALAAVAATGCDPAPALPSVAYTLLDGRRSSTDALRGKVALVHFWATSCAVCVAEMPALVVAERHLAARGLQTLTVTMQHDAPALVSSFAASRQLPFAIAIDNTGAIARSFGDVAATPTTLLFDRQGRLAERWVGAVDLARLRTRAEQLLAAG